MAIRTPRSLSISVSCPTGGLTFPVGYLLEKVAGLGPYSYWIGLIASLIVSGLCYQWRLNRIVKRYESHH